jgi:hypothetical protein
VTNTSTQNCCSAAPCTHRELLSHTNRARARAGLLATITIGCRAHFFPANCAEKSRRVSAPPGRRALAALPALGLLFPAAAAAAGGTAPERSLSFIPTGDGRAPRPCERRAAAVPLLIWRASSSDGTCSAARRGMPPPQGGPAVRLVPSPPPPAAQAIERGAAGVLALRSDPDDERPAVPCRSKRGVGSGGPRAEPPDEPPPGTGSERGRRRRPAPAQSCRRLAQ